MGKDRPGMADSFQVGRDARGAIVLDVTSFEQPPASLRVRLTPEAALVLADELSEAANDDALNMVAYTPQERGEVF